jgi:urocanate hydratase
VTLERAGGDAVVLPRALPPGGRNHAHDPEQSRPEGARPARRTVRLSLRGGVQVAQFPEELITYGGNGSVFSNWAQYHLVMRYLSEMTDEQTLVMYSGHPMGLFPR